MIKELKLQKEREDENKLLEAIHNQAKWRNMEEENKRMMNNIEKELKKSKIKEVLQRESNIALQILVSLPGIIALLLLFMVIANR